jgi:arginyl-tRNA--protein-N-Asp/Glu arginylyltransferase
MIDNNWRRSGTWAYRPNLAKGCCPQYTIRLDVTRFRLSKQQRQVLRRMSRFLRGEAPPAPAVKLAPPRGDAFAEPTSALLSALSHVPAVPPEVVEWVSSSPRGLVCAAKPPKHPHPATPVLSRLNARLKLDPPALEELGRAICDAWNAEFAALARMQPQPGSTLLLLHGLEIPEPSPLNAAASASSSSSVSASASASSDSKTTHTLRVDVVPSRFEEESFKLYVRYQMKVHGDKRSDCTKEQYTRFLCSSPLIRSVGGVAPVTAKSAGTIGATLEAQAKWQQEAWDREVDGSASSAPGGELPAELRAANVGPEDIPPEYGSFHHKYFLDDKLVAVGVVDVLPRCLVSVFGWGKRQRSTSVIDCSRRCTCSTTPLSHTSSWDGTLPCERSSGCSRQALRVRSYGGTTWGSTSTRARRCGTRASTSRHSCYAPSHTHGSTWTLIAGASSTSTASPALRIRRATQQRPLSLLRPPTRSGSHRQRLSSHRPPPRSPARSTCSPGCLSLRSPPRGHLPLWICSPPTGSGSWSPSSGRRSHSSPPRLQGGSSLVFDPNDTLTALRQAGSG